MGKLNTEADCCTDTSTFLETDFMEIIPGNLLYTDKLLATTRVYIYYLVQ